MRYNTVLFDLDGTLTDPAEGIVNSVLYALNKVGIIERNREKLLKFIGPPLTESFSDYYGFSSAEAVRAVDDYREYYSDKGIFQNQLYPGIPELLTTLKNNGKTIALATSKPEVYAKQILKHFDIDAYFDFVGGCLLDGTRVKKGDVIRYTCQALKISKPDAVIMVGDREHDVLGAKANGLPCIGVLFGYGSREELENAGASFLVSTVKELGSIL
ncbi:MAG: HAD family hydrolase [Clostridia bacterium]|nr:HAD family hydrolase [Clostridia bacterium]